MAWAGDERCLGGQDQRLSKQETEDLKARDGGPKGKGSRVYGRGSLSVWSKTTRPYELGTSPGRTANDARTDSGQPPAGDEGCLGGQSEVPRQTMANASVGD